MAIRNVVQIGDETLRKKSFPVENFDESLWTLLDDMKETLRKEEGAGLAAPQVGVLRRAVVVDVEEGFFEFVNPKIISEKGEQCGWEGCLSVRGKRGVGHGDRKQLMVMQNIFVSNGQKTLTAVQIGAEQQSKRRFDDPFLPAGDGLEHLAFGGIGHLDYTVSLQIA